MWVRYLEPVAPPEMEYLPWLETVTWRAVIYG